jgi:drug/metabolite transporter (DMT)-like permease
MNNGKLKIGAGYVLICLLWGSTWMAIRIGLDYLTPFISCGIRFLIGTVFIYLIMLYKKVKLQKDKRSIQLYLFMGFFSFVIPFGLVYWAEQHVPTGLASVLFSIFPFLVILFSRIALPENKIGVYQVLGVILGFIGLIVIFSQGLSLESDFNFWGMGAVFLSAAMQAVVVVVMKKYGGELHALSMNFIPVLIGGIFLTLAGFIFEDSSSWQFSTEAMMSIMYLAFFGTVLTFTTYYWLLKKINVVILSLSNFITPVIALFLGWLFLSEVLTPRDLLGSSFVLIGILFANFRGLKNYYLLNLAKKHD